MQKAVKDLLTDNGRIFDISISGYPRAYYSMPELHYHKHYEILFVCENERILLANDSKTPLNRNNILLMPPFILHRTISGTAPSQKTFLINFTEELAKKIKAFIDIDVNLLFDTDNFTVSLPQKSSDYIYKLILTMYNENEKGSNTGKANALLCLCRLLTELYLLKPSHPDTFQYNKTLSNIIHFFEVHYAEDINAELISEKFVISKYALSRLFKKHTGVTMVQYLNNIRISKAKQLLEDRNKNITEIATLTGYNSATSFSRVFKQIMNISPQNYRKVFIRHHKNNIG